MPLELKDRPDYECAAYREMSAYWQLVADVAGGTKRLRECGITYLPQEEAEIEKHYLQRLHRSVQFNFYGRTLNALTGLVFHSDPVLGEGIPDVIKEDFEDIDLAGNHFDVFSKEAFRRAFDGHSVILVDMPPPLQQGATLADERAQGRRVCWVLYRAKQVKNWDVGRVNGAVQITRITFEETTLEADGQYGEKEVTHYREFRLVDGVVYWYLHRLHKGVGEERFELVGSGAVVGPTRIPVAVIYGRHEGILRSCPPLLDLAYLNITHWQQYSDLLTQLHALVPFILRKGVPTADQKALATGPNLVVDVPEKGDAAYISHDGKHIEAARQELLDVENRAAALGVSMLAAKPDQAAKTAREIRSSDLQQTSDLATMARSAKDAFETCLWFHAQYRGIEPERDADWTIDLGVAEADLIMDGPTILAIDALVKEQHLTLETALTLWKRGGLSALDVQMEIEKLKEQKAETPQIVQPPNPPPPVPEEAEEEPEIVQ